MNGAIALARGKHIQIGHLSLRSSAEDVYSQRLLLNASCTNRYCLNFQRFMCDCVQTMINIRIPFKSAELLFTLSKPRNRFVRAVF